MKIFLLSFQKYLIYLKLFFCKIKKRFFIDVVGVTIMYDKKRYRGELFNTGAKRIEGDFPGMFDVLMVFGRKKKINNSFQNIICFSFVFFGFYLTKKCKIKIFSIFF